MFLLLVFSLLISSITPVLAQNEFSIKQNIDYTLDPSGHGLVLHHIAITNNFSQLYPKNFQFTLSGIQPQNIQASDNSGSILEKIENNGENTSIHLKLSDAKVGKDQVTNFTVRYRLNNLATQKGKTWEISLPKFQSEIDTHPTISVKVPSIFGRLSFSPKNTSVTNDALSSTIHLEKINPNEKIILIFGNFQLFDFHLNYFLKNPNPNPSLIPIAIPPDTNNQKIIFNKLEPKPQKIEMDVDGNWLAYYLLEPSANLTVNIDGQAKIGPRPGFVDSQNTPLIEQLYWPTSHPEIIKLAQTYRSPKSIYDFVVNTLSYDYSRIDSAKRRGALTTLNSPQNSLCTDFTDLFISIARAASIPAREIEGFAYSNNTKIKPLSPNTDILHAWPEYFDTKSQKWIGIDPTWAKTTGGVDYFQDLDLNHLTFVIHNSQSDYPPPPGSYKPDNSQTTIKVDFATSEINQNLSPPTLTIQPRNLFQSELIIVNPNLQSLENIRLSNSSLKLDTQINLLPPFSQKTLPFSLSPFTAKTNITTSFSPDNLTSLTIDNPIHYFFLFILIVLGLICLSLGGIILTRHKTK